MHATLPRVDTPPDDGPRSFGRYRVVRELGRGGMGVVHVAHDPDLGRDVALKVVLAAGADPTAGPRLLREAEAAARLSHPGIVRVLDVGLLDGLPYLAMELVDGPTLSSVLERDGPLAPAEAARIGAGLARALEHAHAQGVVHRDLKPANVLLAGPGRDPKIVDFGLAKDAEASGATLTMTGEILGTPPFMAPEQADGSGKRADGKADVYALGATLHAMLTGVPPFQATSTLGLLTRVLTEQPKPPSARRPGISPALDRLVLRCLEKQPARRPTAGEVAAALEALPRTGRGRPVVALGALAGVVAAGAGLALLARAPTPPPVAAAPSPLQPEAPLPPPGPSDEPAAFAGPEGAWPEEAGWRWRPVDAPGGPVPSDDRAAVHDAAGRRVLVLGGLVGGVALDEVLAWDGRAWSSAGRLPGPRHAGVVALDPATGTLHYACGSEVGKPPSTDLWSTPLRPGRALAWETSAVPAEAGRRGNASQLAGRSRPAFAWDADRAQLVLFGGTTSRETLGGLWVRAAGAWTRLVVERGPAPRFAAATAWDAKRKRLVVFGGAGLNLDDTLGDLWEWDGERWTEGPRGPPGRAQACLVFDGRRCLLVGGARSDRWALDDAWAWDGKGWARLTADGPRPSRRARAALAWDAERKVAVLVGGSGQAGPCPDVAWELSAAAR